MGENWPGAARGVHRGLFSGPQGRARRAASGPVEGGVRGEALMDVDEALRSWVEHCLEKPGKSQGGLAAVLEVSDSAISRMLQGDHRIQTAELPKIAAYLEEPIPGFASARQKARTSSEGPHANNDADAANGG